MADDDFINLASMGNSMLATVLPGIEVPPDGTLEQNKYDFNSRTFPTGIGNGYIGHFMVLNINVQTASIMNNINFAPKLGYNVLEKELSKTDALRYNIDNVWTANGNSLGLVAGGIGTRARFTRRIAESIALYMPNSELTFSDAHDFENISLTKFGGSFISGGAKFLGGVVAGIFGKTGVASGINNIVDGIGNNVGNVSQIVGSPLNPKVEVLFANTFQREFAFDFLFSPSNQKESDDIENIIRTIRFHAAPEYRPNTNQFFWLPPSEFDITFFYMDEENNVVENRNIPRINTCVLKQIDVSYAPSGAYSTFHNGHPVQIRMMLRFIETEVNSKLRIAQGF